MQYRPCEDCCFPRTSVCSQWRWAWVAIVGFVNPLSLGDLLVQRGAHFANAVTNARRLALFGAITATIVIITLSPWLSTKMNGQPIRMEGDVAVTSASPIGSIDSKPPINELFDQTPSSISLEIDGTDVSKCRFPISLRRRRSANTARRSKRDREGDGRFRRPCDVRRRGRTSGDSISIRIERSTVTTHSTTPGSILDNFGMSYVSIPLMVMLCLLTLRLLFEAIGVPYRAWMRKEMMFGPFAIMIFSTSLVGQIMAIVIAAITRSPSRASDDDSDSADPPSRRRVLPGQTPPGLRPRGTGTHETDRVGFDPALERTMGALGRSSWHPPWSWASFSRRAKSVSTCWASTHGQSVRPDHVRIDHRRAHTDLQHAAE